MMLRPRAKIDTAPPPAPERLSCPRCGDTLLPVLYTRPRMGKTMRVRQCHNCGRRLVTFEALVAK